MDFWENAFTVINAAAKARRVPKQDASAAIEAARRLHDADVVYKRRHAAFGVNAYETIKARNEVTAALYGWFNCASWMTTAEMQDVLAIKGV